MVEYLPDFSENKIKIAKIEEFIQEIQSELKQIEKEKEKLI